MNEPIWQEQRVNEELILEIVEIILNGVEDNKQFVEIKMDSLIADGYDKNELIQKIVNICHQKGQTERACVRIIGDVLPIDFDNIEASLPLIPSIVTKKGDEIRFLIADSDVLVYEVEKNEDEGIVSNINSLLDRFMPYKDYIREISQKHFLSLRLSLSSDFAQMNFFLPQEILKKIAELNLNFEMHMFSFGGVVDVSDGE